MPGRTRLFYNQRGKIGEADIVLNPFQQFSTDGTFNTFDLEAALAHEIGHLLGLAHSDVLAATMFAQQGKNGVFSLPAFQPRTLAEDDRAGARRLYGAAEADVCCGAVAGTLHAANDNKPLVNWQIWAEDAVNGKIAASVRTNQTGAFHLGGLTAKNYRIVAQPENRRSSAETIGEIQIENNKTSQLSRKLNLRAASFQPLFVGYNAQISTVAVPLAGANQAVERWQTVFVGGDKLGADKLVDKFFDQDISISPQFLPIVPASLVKQDFDALLPVYSFNLRVQPNAPIGEYSLRWQKPGGETIYLLGCISLEAE